MNEHLLDIIYDNKPPPIAASITVNPQLKPFLVTSKSSLVWTELVQSGSVPSIVRDPGDNIQADVLAAIVEKSHEEKWGNLFHLNEGGFNQSIQYLRKSGFQDIDVLVNPETGLESINEEGVTIQEASWMPLDCAVFVPEDREYVGTLIMFEKGPSCCVCVHNSKLGLAIAVKV